MGRECDLLCIGGGLGGLAAALRAADAGLEVLVVEKSPLIGGVAAYSGGVVWVGDNHLQRQAGLDDSAQEATDYLRWVARDGGSFDADLLATFVRRAPEAVEYFTRLGVAFTSTGLGDQYHPDAPGSKASGRILEVTAPGSALGIWRDRFRSSPHFRLLGLTHDEVRRAGGDLVAGDVLADLHRQRQEADLLTWGPGLSAGFAIARARPAGRADPAGGSMRRTDPPRWPRRRRRRRERGRPYRGARPPRCPDRDRQLRERPLGGRTGGITGDLRSLTTGSRRGRVRARRTRGSHTGALGPDVHDLRLREPDRAPSRDGHAAAPGAVASTGAAACHRREPEGATLRRREFLRVPATSCEGTRCVGTVPQLPVLSHRRQPLPHPLPPRRRGGMAGHPCAGIEPR